MRRGRQTRRKRQRGGSPVEPVEELAGRPFRSQLKVILRDGRQAAGQLVKREAMIDAPNVEWPIPQDFRTLICFDPDAPARAWLHWLVVNCDGSGPHSGNTFMEWAPPDPPSGIHRYYVCLFQHSARVADEDRPTQRGYFKVKEFLDTYGMRPVAATMVKVRSQRV